MDRAPERAAACVAPAGSPASSTAAPAAPQPIDIDHNELFQLLRKEAFYSSVLNVNVDGKKEMCLLRDVQRHPTAS
jgi:ribosomal protein L25 (general stress protein Ctc)